jgi:hypothetical protein
LPKLISPERSPQVLSLGNATPGVLNTASLAVNTIGRGRAVATGGVPKHTTKQVDRLLSNEGPGVDAPLASGCLSRPAPPP